MAHTNVKKEKKNLKVSIFEIVWYSLCGAVALWGLVYIILGLIGDNINIISSDNDLKQFSNTIQKYFGLPALYWGMIIFAIGMIAIIVVLIIYSKKSERNYEKQQRRAAIRASAQASLNETANEEEPEVIDVTPINEETSPENVNE